MAAVNPSPKVGTQVKMFDLRPVLALAEKQIQTHVAEMLAAGQFILGPQTLAFEQEFAASMGGAASVGVGSGTSALELCLRAAGIRGEVIVPSLTSLFTAQAVLAAGATLRIADVDPTTLLLTAREAEQAWTSRVEAVIAVHLYGQPANVEELSALCSRRGAVLIQDCCQAHGARYSGRPLADYSPYCAYSFYPTKNLGCLGDGGAIVTSSPALADRFRQLRDGGRRGDQLCREPAINSRLDEMQSCYLRALLPHLEAGNGLRRRQAARYNELLQSSCWVNPLPYNGDSVYHLYVVRSTQRDAVRRHLESLGIQTAVHYPVPLHLQPGLSSNATWAENPEHATMACQEILSLPLGPHIGEEDQRRVASAIEEFPG